MEKFINPSKLQELNSISGLMANELRKSIINDFGDSRLKAKALDFITSMRFAD